MTTQYEVKDISLSTEGDLAIEWSSLNMPVLAQIKEEFESTKPLKGVRVAACLHVTKETAGLMNTLKAGGAQIALCGSNPLSTQNHVAAALAQSGMRVFAWRGQSKEEYYYCIDRTLEIKPNITLDDGADLISTIHSKKTELLKDIVAGCEETTTGVIRLRAMAKDGKLKYPILAANDSQTKRNFDNVYGTGQSTMDGILRATSILIAGKEVVVAGYGYCSKGIATRARGLGGHVIVTEVDPVKALQAAMDGFSVMPMSKASEIGDLFVTSTGDKNVIDKVHLKKMKSGAILANSGHFNVEINIPALEAMSKGKKVIRPNVEQYETKDGRKLYLLAEGRLVNLAAAEGHPSEVMDMSFSDQALGTQYMLEHGKNLKPDVYVLPKELDDKVAYLKLKSMGIEIDYLTPEQEKYITSWDEGT
ncbi:MAG: adenosylhomocysteinase [Candidatus Helarchaeota archaeon]|nr:adenosylhomocysteinase [Candidatus Helarchaeota archaeon]